MLGSYKQKYEEGDFKNVAHMLWTENVRPSERRTIFRKLQDLEPDINMDLPASMLLTYHFEKYIWPAIEQRIEALRLKKAEQKRKREQLWE